MIGVAFCERSFSKGTPRLNAAIRATRTRPRTLPGAIVVKDAAPSRAWGRGPRSPRTPQRLGVPRQCAVALRRHREHRTVAANQQRIGGGDDAMERASDCRRAALFKRVRMRSLSAIKRSTLSAILSGTCTTKLHVGAHELARDRLDALGPDAALDRTEQRDVGIDSSLSSLCNMPCCAPCRQIGRRCSARTGDRPWWIPDRGIETTQHCREISTASAQRLRHLGVRVLMPRRRGYGAARSC